LRPAVGAWPPRFGNRAELGLLDILAEQGEGACEDCARITARELTPQQRLDHPEIVVGLLADRELDSVTLRGHRSDDRTVLGKLGDGAGKTKRSSTSS
jgi:hypothetical protein